MVAIKILHTADVHFGVENYGRIDSSTGMHSRLLDFIKSFDFIVDKAIEKNVDVFILAGDAYKTSNPSPTHQKFLLQALLRLQKANIAVVIVVGNHDHPVSFGKAHALDLFASLPVSGFYVFSRPEALTISTKSGKVQIVGIPWPSRQNILAKDDFRYKDFDKITEYISSGVTQIISDLAHSLDPSIPAVLTGHLTVSSGVFSGSEKKAVFGNDPLFFTSSLAIAPFNYVALGHLHRFQSLNSEGQIPVVYAGSIERVDFGEVRDTKGFAIVDIATTKDYVGSYHRMANVEFVPIPVRKMIEINVRLKLDGDQFTKQILDEIKKIELSDAIVKLFYHIPPGSCDTTDISLILKSLQAAWFVAGVFPVCKPVARNSRLGFEQNKDFSATELLAKYFEHKGIEKNHSSELLKQACCIIDSVNLESITNLSET